MMVMLAKGRSLKGCTCTIIGAVVGLSLVLPIFFTGTSLSEKILLDWLMWSKSPDYTVDYAYDYSPSGKLRSSEAVPRGGERCLLKVYVYDFPRRLHLGMLKNTVLDQDLPWTDDETPPVWPLRSGLKKQHNVEYWMMVDLLDRRISRDGDRQVVRVSNPEHADLFFVPFFSSLSFNRYGHYMRDPDTEKDRLLQEEAANLTMSSKYWKRSGGQDHIIPVHHPNAFRFYRNMLNASIFIVADFGRNPPEVSSLRKDVVAPYTHVVPTYVDDNEEDPFNSRKTLLFFQGRIKRKDDGVVRTQLASVLQNQTEVHFEDGTATEEGLQQATVGMRSSKFCLHPAGDTPSSCRLFDAIASHCVPVIISDKIELPYEDVLDYSTFALFYSVEESLEPDWLVEQLRNISQEQWLAMWIRLKQVAHHFEYQFPTKRDDAVNMIWRELHKKVPEVKLKMHRKQRLKIADWWTW
ncbi:putative arabinosyltransferase [Marchantia polymorpha subsp. ruderalis]|uniref:Exostosin GT47 domain-containing protein n=2 Tax=Marchantia polymorpha TaxID=3197 RepID=A0AAF6BE57_MARPO|nr:hypothetical protein MARPO_0147s0031 [Marchantia polymorpha]BBN10291.1 hypothetical protein Mp_5g02380 [Marchantia polymorpha subsp. ruderalis]|eukprot:PTQ29152.1 hypothetical protein MARPO_0147s0031 [Marchantia polymorpha]